MAFLSHLKNLFRASSPSGFPRFPRHDSKGGTSKFCSAFLEVLADADIESVMLPPRSLDLNACVKRFMRSLKEDRLGRMIFFGENSLRRTVNEYVAHYHREVTCRERLGGLPRYYHRSAL